jgi:hypothetical protein
MGELFFRPQMITVLEGAIVMGADEDTVSRNAQAGDTGNIMDLLKGKSMTMRSADLDVLHEENATEYWARNEDFDFAVQLNFGHEPINHFCRVLEKWIEHFLGVKVRITPMQQISDPKWSWHVGLDAVATEILNKLYNKESVEADELEKVICLFRLDFIDEAALAKAQAGKPVYMAIAMNEQKQLKLKPQLILKPQLKPKLQLILRLQHKLKHRQILKLQHKHRLLQQHKHQLLHQQILKLQHKLQHKPQRIHQHQLPHQR